MVKTGKIYGSLAVEMDQAQPLKQIMASHWKALDSTRKPYQLSKENKTVSQNRHTEM